MKNKVKKILKIMLKTIIVLIVIYIIYVIAHIIYANCVIDKVVNAVYEEDINTLEKYEDDSIREIISNIKNNQNKPTIKNFSFEKKDTVNILAFLGEIKFKYEISTVDLDKLRENGTHTNNLMENFDEIFIKERQLQKIVKKKTGTYDTDLEITKINKNDRETCLDEEVYYELINEAAFADENEYLSNELSKIELNIYYNIFTHEFERIEYMYDIKYGSILKRDITNYYNEKYLEQCMLENFMCKKGERPINIISLNGKFVSLFEENEGNEINDLEKFFIENNYSMEQVENYLLGEGYIYGKCIEFVDEESDTSFAAIFDKDTLLYIDGYTKEYALRIGENVKYSSSDEFYEYANNKIKYFIENNLTKDEIIDEFIKDEYYITESFLFYDMKNNLERTVKSDNYEYMKELEQLGYKKEEIFEFYKSNYGYVYATFIDGVLYCFDGHGSNLEKEIGNYIINNDMTKEELIERLEKDGFVLETSDSEEL